jgi:hypothetical protein
MPKLPFQNARAPFSNAKTPFSKAKTPFSIPFSKRNSGQLKFCHC